MHGRRKGPRRGLKEYINSRSAFQFRDLVPQNFTQPRRPQKEQQPQKGNEVFSMCSYCINFYRGILNIHLN